MSQMQLAELRKAALLGAVAMAACGFALQPELSAAAPQPIARTAFTNGSAAMPADSAGIAVYRAAQRYPGIKILISTADKWLWFVLGQDTLLSAPVAIGMGTDFEYNGKKYNFSTPRGRRKVLKKEENPIWTVPSWHYYEKATQRGLDAINVKPGEVYLLYDATWIEMRGIEVGRVNQFGNWWPFTPGVEIIFDGKLFIPPMNSPQRRVPEALGPVKLDMGEGYLIHGTHVYNESSIGQAVSHGCVRMRNEDVERLYFMVDTGTPVFIF